MPRYINLRALRTSQNIKQAELAEILGVAAPYLSEIERGKRPVSDKVYQVMVEKFGADVCEEYLLPDPINIIVGDISGGNPQFSGRDSVSVSSESLSKLMDAISGQTELLRISQQQTVKAQEQIDRLISLLEKNTNSH
ncbi:MAG: helix-turn-helix transcriptional regulator [Muribaculaceae bacterium]|nr:helix-turn-helix transcriptional regulator [Muribaculaceae bacterium]